MTHVESTDLDPLMQGETAEAAAPAPLSPHARLAASRAALQQWLDHTYHPERLTAAEAQQASDAAAPPPGPDEPAWLGLLVDSLSDVPVASIAVRYLRRWWARHPLKATADLAGAASHELLAPTAARHPWLLLGGALLAGAALSRARPWRWVSGSALLASIVPPISIASILSSATAMFNSLHPGAAEPASNDDPAEPGPGGSDTQAQAPSTHAEEQRREPLSEAA